MALPIVIALLAVWAAATVLAVSLCVISGRNERRRQPLYLISSR
jgi:hypothetical protein